MRGIKIYHLVIAFMASVLVNVTINYFSNMRRPPKILDNIKVFALSEDQRIVCNYENENWQCKAFENAEYECLIEAVVDHCGKGKKDE